MRKPLTVPLSLADKGLIATAVIVVVALVFWIASPWVIAISVPLNAIALPAPFDRLSLGSVAYGVLAACLVTSAPSVYHGLCADLAQSRALVVNHD